MFTIRRSFVCLRKYKCNEKVNFKSQSYVASFATNSPDRLVSVIEEEKTATILMKSPPVNSLNFELLRDLTSAIKDLENKRVKGLVLSSSMPTVFSAGLDITEMYKPQEERFRVFWKSFQDCYKTLYLTPMITIAAINGHAPAGGCMLAMSCDYRIMQSSGSTIGLNETQLGLAAPRWLQQLMVNTIGFRLAERSLNCGTVYSAEDALRIGLIDEVASDADDLKEKVSRQMAEWLKVPGTPRQVTKQMLRQPFVDKLKAYEEEEHEQIYQVISADIVQKALGAYMEKLKSKKS